MAVTLLKETLMTEKLARRGIRVAAEYEVDVLRTIPIRAIMTRAVQTLPSEVTVGDARRRFQTAKHSAYPIVTPDGGIAGIVARRDVLATPDLPDDAPIAEVASRQVVTVSADDVALTALQAMVEGRFGHVPVVEDGTLVGIVTRTDIVRTRMRQLELERLQPGWAPRPPLQWRPPWSWRQPRPPAPQAKEHPARSCPRPHHDQRNPMAAKSPPVSIGLG